MIQGLILNRLRLLSLMIFTLSIVSCGMEEEDIPIETETFNDFVINYKKIFIPELEHILVSNNRNEIIYEAADPEDLKIVLDSINNEDRIDVTLVSQFRNGADKEVVVYPNFQNGDTIKANKPSCFEDYGFLKRQLTPNYLELTIHGVSNLDELHVPVNYDEIESFPSENKLKVSGSVLKGYEFLIALKQEDSTHYLTHVLSEYDWYVIGSLTYSAEVHIDSFIKSEPLIVDGLNEPYLASVIFKNKENQFNDLILSSTKSILFTPPSYDSVQMKIKHWDEAGTLDALRYFEQIPSSLNLLEGDVTLAEVDNNHHNIKWNNECDEVLIFHVFKNDDCKVNFTITEPCNSNGRQFFEFGFLRDRISELYPSLSSCLVDVPGTVIFFYNTYPPRPFLLNNHPIFGRSCHSHDAFFTRPPF